MELYLTGGDLTNYQQKILKFFKTKTKNVLLMYLTVGSGKTLLSLACAIDALNSGKAKQIIILTPKSIQHEFIKNLELYKSFNIKIPININQQIKMIAYNANNSQIQFQNLGNIENSVFIIDELHLFMKSVIKVNLEPNEKIRNIGNAKNIFDQIKKTKNKKVIGLTGTPSAKFPFELIPFFNLDPSVKLPETIPEFENEYIDPINKKIKNQQQLISKLKNKVVYFAFENLKSNLEQVEVEMSEPQYIQYLKDYEKELNEKKIITGHNVYGMAFGMKSTFHMKTFQDSIYWNETKRSTAKQSVAKQSTAKQSVAKQSMAKQSVAKQSVAKQIKIDALHCPKLLKMYSDTTKINGLCVFYFRFIDKGIDIMAELLKKKGFNEWNGQTTKQKSFIIFSGKESSEQKRKIKEIYNSYENRHGEIVKYLLLSSCGSVGITLKNVRYLGIGSVEFNYSAIQQILGRVNRLNSHADLEPSKRTITTKIYFAVKNQKYYLKHKSEIDLICNRTTYKYNEKGLCIERIIFQDSIYDDLINIRFRELLQKIGKL